MTVWIENPFDNLPTEGLRKQRYWMLSEAFVRAGHRVVYFTSDFSHATKAPRVLKTPVEDAGIECVLVPTPAYRSNASLARVRSHRIYAQRLFRLATSRTTAERPDIVIAATPSLSSAAAMQKVARSVGAFFVLDVQDAWPETFHRLLPAPLGPLGRILFAGLYRTARGLYRTADMVTGVCDRYAALTGRTDYARFYLGVPADESVPQSAAEAGKVRLVYAGNLGLGYDLETVLAVVAQDERLTLDVAGFGPREAALRTRACGRVRFHGLLAVADLRALLCGCDVGIIPMRDDSWVGLPNKLGDYLSAGLRVVSSLHGECGTFLARAGAGETYDFGSAASLRAALDRVLSAASGKRTVLPDCLREDRIYPAFVAAITSRARTCR